MKRKAKPVLIGSRCRHRHGSPRRAVARLTLAVLCGLLSACTPGLRLTPIEAAHRRPANVAVFFRVDTRDGEPVSDLLAEDFHIYEDGALVSVDESRQTILNPEVAAAHYTLLLVDMSASVTESDKLALVVAAAGRFVEALQASQRVAVYAFDGSAQLAAMVPFTAAAGPSARGVSRLQQFQTRDPSTNLHGAVVRALAELDRAIAADRTPLRFGTLVVFTDGTDRAARVSQQEMLDALQASEHDAFAIGVGNEIDDATLSRIGAEGYIRVEDGAAIADAFDEIGDRIAAITRCYYLLSYCSPARAGQHTVTIEAVSGKARGTLDYGFDATGFSGQCDPTRPPPFDTSGRTARSRRALRSAQGAEPR